MQEAQRTIGAPVSAGKEGHGTPSGGGVNTHTGNAGTGGAGGRTHSTRVEETMHMAMEVEGGDEVALLEALLGVVDRHEAGIDEVLAELGESFFVVEHGWRRLFARLMAEPGQQRRFKRRALADYLIFLRRLAGKPAAPSGTPASHAQVDAAGTAPGSPPPTHLQALEPQRPTQLHFGGKHPVECRLASCTAWIRPGIAPLFVVPGQRSFNLETGRATVGRDPSCDIVLDQRWPDVSRHHLVIELTQDHRLILTDVSSYGTLVTSSAIGE